MLCNQTQIVSFRASDFTDEVFSCSRGPLLIWLLGQDVVEVDSIGVLAETHLFISLVCQYEP